jgi:microcin C transport system substrate-binding protein
MDIPVTSGPYAIASFEPGRWIVYKRRADYWARDLNVNKGMYNFDEIRYDYYRDTAVALEAFKAGLIDLRQETEAKKWTEFKKSKDVQNGKIIMRQFEHHFPSGMQGFVYNLRRPIFADPRVREALAYAFDFEWANENLFFGMYKRTESYFDNSELKAPPLPG